MMEADTENGKKRRLPVWMLGVSDAGKVRNPKKQDEGYFPLKGVSQSDGNRFTAKPTTSQSRKKVCMGETKTSDGDSCHLLTCETSKRTWKASRKNGCPSSFFSSSQEAEVQKKASKKDSTSKPTEVKRTASMKHKSKVSKNSEEPEAASSMEGSDDEVELNMEDLMSIALEYVAADAETQCQQAVKRDVNFDPFANSLVNVSAEMENQQQQAETKDSKFKACSLKSSSFISKKNLGGSLQLAGNNTGLSKCTFAPSHVTEARTKEKENQALDYVPTHIPKTGDVTQDMLDLFLGPLLKRPKTDERRLETTTADKMTLALQSSKQDRSEESGKGENVPLTKKKSSLKDKVAQFLE